MSFNDIIKKSFLEGYSASVIGTREIIIALVITTILALYVFYCYRLLMKKTFYSNAFNVSLVAVSVITAGIILTIQSSFVVSLGMVGALSIVRFRTAIKDPMDLAFLFWAISIGIICGAGLAEIAVILSLILTIAIFLLDKVPMGHSPMILVINAENDSEIDTALNTIMKSYVKRWTVKSRSISNGQVNMVIELRVHDGGALTRELSNHPQVLSVSLLKHDGEVTF